MQVPIENLRPDSDPVRRRPATAEDDAGLRASMVKMGQLEPVLVVRVGDDFDEPAIFEVKEGNRRLAFARELGWLALEVSELPRRDPAYTLAAATAASTVFAPLTGPDQWRALQDLVGRGYSMPDAAAALGLSERQAARLDRLGRLHPTMLALIEAHGMPPQAQLRVIAAAPPATQAKAAKLGVSSGPYAWHTVTEAWADDTRTLCTACAPNPGLRCEPAHV